LLSKRGAIFFRFVSALLSVCLALSLPIPAYSLSANEGIVSLLDPASIPIPEDLGKIEESFKGSSGKLVIYIQDAHTNYSAQKNIAAIINRLVSDHGIHLVTVEAAQGDIETELFRSFPIPEVSERVMDRFMRKGEIGGPQYASITGKTPFEFVGVDKSELYKENLSQFLAVLSDRESGLSFIRKAELGATQLKTVLYSKEARELDRLLETHTAQFTDLLSFLNRLRAKADELGEPLDDYAHLNRLMEHSEQLKNGEMAEEKVREEFKTVDPIVLFNEIEHLSFELKYKLAESEEARRLIRLERYLTLLKHGFSLELTREDVTRLKGMQNDFMQDKIISFMESISTQHTLDTSYLENMRSIPLDDYIAQIFRFYEGAEAREKEFEKRLKREMLMRFEQSAVLVTGGYHREGMLKRFRAENISYAVITPVIDGLTDHEKYLDLMRASGQLLSIAPGTNNIALAVANYGELGIMDRMNAMFSAPYRDITQTELEATATSFGIPLPVGADDPQLAAQYLKSEIFRRQTQNTAIVVGDRVVGFGALNPILMNVVRQGGDVLSKQRKLFSAISHVTIHSPVSVSGFGAETEEYKSWTADALLQRIFELRETIQLLLSQAQFVASAAVSESTVGQLLKEFRSRGIESLEALHEATKPGHVIDQAGPGSGRFFAELVLVVLLSVPEDERTMMRHYLPASLAVKGILENPGAVNERDPAETESIERIRQQIDALSRGSAVDLRGVIREWGQDSVRLEDSPESRTAEALLQRIFDLGLTSPSEIKSAGLADLFEEFISTGSEGLDALFNFAQPEGTLAQTHPDKAGFFVWMVLPLLAKIPEQEKTVQVYDKAAIVIQSIKSHPRKNERSREVTERIEGIYLQVRDLRESKAGGLVRTRSAAGFGAATFAQAKYLQSWRVASVSVLFGIANLFSSAALGGPKSTKSPVHSRSVASAGVVAVGAEVSIRAAAKIGYNKKGLKPGTEDTVRKLQRYYELGDDLINRFQAASPKRFQEFFGRPYSSLTSADRKAVADLLLWTEIHESDLLRATTVYGGLSNAVSQAMLMPMTLNDLWKNYRRTILGMAGLPANFRKPKDKGEWERTLKNNDRLRLTMVLHAYHHALRIRLPKKAKVRDVPFDIRFRSDTQGITDRWAAHYHTSPSASERKKFLDRVAMFSGDARTAYQRYAQGRAAIQQKKIAGRSSLSPSGFGAAAISEKEPRRTVDLASKVLAAIEAKRPEWIGGAKTDLTHAMRAEFGDSGNNVTTLLVTSVESLKALAELAQKDEFASLFANVREIIPLRAQPDENYLNEIDAIVRDVFPKAALIKSGIAGRLSQIQGDRSVMLAADWVALTEEEAAMLNMVPERFRVNISLQSALSNYLTLASNTLKAVLTAA